MNTDEHTPLWIRGARVIDPSTGRDDARGEVFAKDGRFVDKLSKSTNIVPVAHKAERHNIHSVEKSKSEIR